MKRVFKKSFLLLIIGVIGILQIGCNSNTITKDKDIIKKGEPIWDQHKDEPVTLDWYINFSWFNTPWGNNLVSETITKETGVDISFVVPKGNESEKLDSMIATDTLPDIITLGWWEGQNQDMISKDMIYPLNLLAEEYNPYFFKVANETVLEWYKQEDGNIYYYPNSFYTPKDYEENENIASNQTFLVRKDLYEAIGSPDMTTPEGFKDAIVKVTKMFPTVNGEPLIPIGADEFTSGGCNSFDKYLQNFLAIPFEKNGTYYDRYTDSEYIRWLKLFRELNEEGYLAKDIFIDKRVQMEEKISKGRYFCMLYQRVDMEKQQKSLYTNDPNSIYIAVDGPKNSKQDVPLLPGAGVNGWTVTMISKNCKYPERAIVLLSYLMSEHGQKLVYLGVEGVTYDVIEGKPVIKEEIHQLLNTDRAKYDEIYGADDAYWMMQDTMMQSKWKPESLEPMAQLEEWTYPYTVYTSQYDIIFPAGSEMANNSAKITDEWSVTLPLLLLSQSEEEFDLILNEFINKREDYGYTKLMDESTKQMNELKGRLGLR